jgi:hypothetical protein
VSSDEQQKKEEGKKRGGRGGGTVMDKLELGRRNDEKREPAGAPVGSNGKNVCSFFFDGGGGGDESIRMMNPYG